jgi:hypothetical protein
MNKFADFLCEKQVEICKVINNDTDMTMAWKCNMPIQMWQGFRTGRIKPPEQKLLADIAMGLNMSFTELRQIAESRIW